MSKKYGSYSVVLKFYDGDFLVTSWTRVLDSTTKSGATRKASGYLKGTFFKPVKKTRIDNYEYWKCEDK